MLLCGCLALAGCGDSADDGEADIQVGSGKGQSGGLRNPDGGGEDNSGQAGDDKDGEDDETGDGAGNKTESSGSYWDPKGSVVPGTYLGISVDKITFEVSDEEVQEEIDYFLQSQAELIEVEGRNTVEEGDVVNVDFTLYIDGADIDEETGSNVELGSHSYDFEEGLIGALVGECKTVETEIEDVYYSDYLGQTGTYVVTINKIQKQLIPELTDELIGNTTDYSTVEEYRQSVYEGLMADAEQQASNEQIHNLFEKIFEASQFTGLADEDQQSYVDGMISYYTAYASYFGMDIQSFAEVNGYTYDDFLKMLQEDAEFMVKEYLLLDAVAEAEKLEVSDQEYTDGLTAYASQNGYESPQDAENELGKEAILRDMRRDKAYSLIVDSMILN